jgi:hypothetical protein
MSSRTVPPHLVDIYDTIKSAIVNRRQLIVMYGGLRREVCPHSLGWKGDHLACFAFQFGGFSRQPLPPKGQWRCLHLHQMSQLQVREGEWHTGPIDPQSSSCIDEFDAYVGFPQGAKELDQDPDVSPETVAALLPLVESLDGVIVEHIEDALQPLRLRIEELERQLARLREDHSDA